MANPALKPAPVKGSKTVIEKAKAVAFVNWRIADENGETLLRSSKGFSLFANEYLTLEEKALIQLARDNGGSATVVAEMRIVLHHDKPESLDTSKIKLIKK